MLEELVRLSGKCHEHFAREFAKRLGMTPARYLARHRIERAARMLAKSNLKTSVISKACGFDSVSHFFRQFTPLERDAPVCLPTDHGLAEHICAGVAPKSVTIYVVFQQNVMKSIGNVLSC